VSRPFSKTLARAEYEAKHWGEPGQRGDERLRVGRPTGRLVLLGDLVELTYRTRKAGDGVKAADYVHAFETPYPRLCINRNGLLIIAGGAYHVSDRGIVG
jgi:hypothetical protein